MAKLNVAAVKGVSSGEYSACEAKSKEGVDRVGFVFAKVGTSRWGLKRKTQVQLRPRMEFVKNE